MPASRLAFARVAFRTLIAKDTLIIIIHHHHRHTSTSTSTMAKRKASQLEETSTAPRRSARQKAVASTRDEPSKETKKAKVTRKVQTKSTDGDTSTGTKPVEARKTNGDVDASASSDRWYWLMKAEPESRFENGVDVKFSIDDLASRTDPEPWDGIRAYGARNNLRAMKKGEMAFFYHSNCKEPGIVGTMEIMQEHSPDVSAHDPKAPYYDPSSKPEDPKWSVVHVKFHSKFAKPIGLKELREMGKPGKPLENMQMLKQSRLSVSRVSPSEWDHLMDLVGERGGEVSK
ncbi:PUA-like domain-containing protein [Xylaria nigripes]|nr:PUA-like domain-containing protein [Xylaria nigripes]